MEIHFPRVNKIYPLVSIEEWVYKLNFDSPVQGGKVGYWLLLNVFLYTSRPLPEIRELWSSCMDICWKIPYQQIGVVEEDAEEVLFLFMPDNLDLSYYLLRDVCLLDSMFLYIRIQRNWFVILKYGILFFNSCWTFRHWYPILAK